MSIWNFKSDNKGYHPIDKKWIRGFNKIRAKDKRKLLCHAPFKSMTFYPTGAVLACWYNKLFPLGNYPKDSINDIWFSKRAEKLRNHIKNNDLSYGCTGCRNHLKNKNYYSSGMWRYDFLPENTNGYPVSIDFQMSHACNLLCIMCNGEYSENIRINREKKELYEKPYDENFIPQLEPFIPFLKEASFSGGEPFMCKDYFDIWDMMIAKNHHIRISVTTNGTLLNEKIIKYLDSLPFNVSVSIDAITPELYEKIRVNGKIEPVLKNIEYFIKYTKKKGTVMAAKTCAMRQNWIELPALAEYMNKRDIPFLYNYVVYPANCSLWNLSSGKLKEISEYLKNKMIEQGNTYNQKNNFTRYNDLIRQIDIWYHEAISREQMNIDKMNVSQLKDIFFKKVDDYFAAELSGQMDECIEKINNVKNLIDNLIKESPSEKYALSGMKYLATVPIDKWLADMEIRDYEKNKDRFYQIGMFDEETIMNKIS